MRSDPAPGQASFLRRLDPASPVARDWTSRTSDGPWDTADPARAPFGTRVRRPANPNPEWISHEPGKYAPPTSFRLAGLPMRRSTPLWSRLPPGPTRRSARAGHTRPRVPNTLAHTARFQRWPSQRIPPPCEDPLR